MNKKYLIILPTYNEKENLAPLCDRILKDPQLPACLDILVVDDNSPDGTWLIAQNLSLQNSRIHVLHRPKKQGLGPAYIEGFKWALARDFDFIFQMDTDFSHDPMYLKNFIVLSSSYDLIIGSRYVKNGDIVGWGLFRKLLSRFGSFYARTILQLPLRDLTSGFKCFHRKVLESFDFSSIKSKGYCFLIELNYKTYLQGFKITETAIVFVNRTKGKSKMSIKIMAEAFLNVLRLKSLTKKKNSLKKICLSLILFLFFSCSGFADSFYKRVCIMPDSNKKNSLMDMSIAEVMNRIHSYNDIIVEVNSKSPLKLTLYIKKDKEFFSVVGVFTIKDSVHRVFIEHGAYTKQAYKQALQELADDYYKAATVLFSAVIPNL